MHLAAVTRLEELEPSAIEYAGGRAVTQYRGELIPIVPANPGMALAQDGVQPVLLVSDAGRTVGVAIEEVVDIVEERLDVQPIGQGAGIVGTAVIRGQATEIVDVAQFLPVPEGFGAPTASHRPSGRSRIVLLDSAPFYRGMLLPVLNAAGYHVIPLADVDSALAVVRREPVDAIVVDVEAPGRNGFDLAEELRGETRFGRLPIVGLTSRPDSGAIDRARRLAFADLVAKFDRAGLLEALAECASLMEDAA